MATKKKTTTESGIVMLPVDELVPHPDNPRREIGDVTDLAENIKKHGIRQNLTVVDYGNSGYRIIIGHRRHAAAKLAGLKEVPCVIADMSEREQLETMLAENLMREDLKLSEQVRTFEQLHLEGAEAEDIAKTTGFSSRYVSDRLKYARLIGADELKTIEERAENNKRQVTLDEIDKLCSIKSPAERQKLSEAVGTNNFSWDYRAAKEQETARENVTEARRILKERGYTELLNHQTASDKYTTANRFFVDVKAFINSPDKALSEKMPADNTEPVYFTFPNTSASWFYICIGEPGAAPKPDPKIQADVDEREKKRAALEEKREKLNDALSRAYESRVDFMNMLVSTDITDPALVSEFCMFSLLHGDCPDAEYMADMFDMPKQGDTDDERYYEMIIGEAAKKRTEKSALCAVTKMAFICFNDYAHRAPYNLVYNAESVTWLIKLYEYLGRFGYDISDEEKALIYGTHELYESGDEK